MKLLIQSEVKPKKENTEYLHFIEAYQVCEKTLRQTWQFVVRQIPLDTKRKMVLDRPIIQSEPITPEH